MLKEWQFNVLFFVGVGGAILLLIGPEFGLKMGQNPTAITGIGSILAYVLTQRKSFTNRGPDKPTIKPKEPDDNEPR